MTKRRHLLWFSSIALFGALTFNSLSVWADRNSQETEVCTSREMKIYHLDQWSLLRIEDLHIDEIPGITHDVLKNPARNRWSVFQTNPLTPLDLCNRYVEHQDWLRENGANWFPVHSRPDRRSPTEDVKKLSYHKCGDTTSPGKNFDRLNLSLVDFSQLKKYGAVHPEMKVDLRGACFRKADLRGAILRNVDLRGANFYKADLTGAVLRYSDLEGAVFDSADLSGADLTTVNLTKANFQSAIMAGTYLSKSNLTEVYFNPHVLPSPQGLSRLEGLETLTYGVNAAQLLEFRDILIDAGMRDAGREVNFALNKTRNERSSVWARTYNVVLFGWTSDYGMSPGKPLIGLGLIVLGLTLVYCFPIYVNTRSGVYRVWPEDRIEDRDRKSPERVLGNESVYPFRGAINAFHFSVLSAFHFGFRGLSVGNWMARIQPREYSLQATGWVRVVSGLQSLVCFYLFALWVVMYVASLAKEVGAF
ncbi:MAG: pentapeptide repeat-containing protein [Pseudomonadota bacterium]